MIIQKAMSKAVLGWQIFCVILRFFGKNQNQGQKIKIKSQRKKFKTGYYLIPTIGDTFNRTKNRNFRLFLTALNLSILPPPT